jgi:hypothetical protein
MMKVDCPVRGEFDCVVCGGGLSGFTAAVTAARAGLSVAIVEQSGCFGGVATSGCVNHLLGGRKYDGTTGRVRRTVGGFFDELSDRLIREGGAIDPDTIDPANNPHGWYPRMAAGIPFDGEHMKRLLDTISIEEKLSTWFLTRVVGIEAAGENGENVDSGGRRIDSLVLHNKSGFFSLRASLVIDATGDADIAVLAGCPTEKGRMEDGLMTPASLEFHVDGVDREAFLAYQNEHRSPKLVEIIERLRHEGIWDFPFSIFIAVQLVDPDIFLVNTIRQVGVDGTDGNSLTRALMEGRRDDARLFAIMKEHFPGFGRARIRKVAETIGIRETRRIVGLAQVTTADALSGRHYDDCVARSTYNFDLPDPLRPSYDTMMGDAANPRAERTHESIEVPYGCMVPRGCDNLIMTGRTISVDREVLGPMRIMGPCMMLGQAAGTAAGLAAKTAFSFPAIDGKDVRARMMESGSLF